MNTDCDVLDEARRLLKIWGKWERSIAGRSYRISYPGSVAFTHAGEQREEPIPVAENPIAETIDKILCILKRTSHIAFKAVFCEYCLETTNLEGADYCKCSEAVYKKRRSYAEHFVAGAIAEKNF